MRRRRSHWIGSPLAVIGLSLSLGIVSVGAESLPKPGFDEDGRLLRPDKRYRSWVYVGTPLTPNELNPPEAAFPEFHNVYIHPDDYEHYQTTGKFQDGTVILKELVTVGSKQAVSGNGYFMGEYVGLEAAIKSKERFPDEPGNWAYFSFGHAYPLADSAEAFPAAACNSCHLATAADDFVFTQYYPVLRDAREPSRRQPMGKGDSEYERIEEAMSGAMEAARQGSTPPLVRSAVPTDPDKLFAYLKAGKYREFEAQESANHPSTGPHSKFGRPVRVYLDPVLARSLADGNKQHPVGAAAVKEMFTESGKLEGWAVSVKTAADSASGQGWFWYENTSTTSNENPVAAGNGVPLCYGCHTPGRDYILTDFPLK